jgi:hypothetical protein
VTVKAGDTIDFVTGCRANVTSDSFTWRVELTLAEQSGASTVFRSQEGFHGPAATAAGVDLASVVKTWQLAYSRLPSREELQAACEFLTQQRGELRSNPRLVLAGRSPETQALANLCHALLSSNEFLYVD